MIIHDCDLTNYNAYRVRAICKTAYFPKTEDEVVKAMILCKDRPSVILGSGHNVILSKTYYSIPFLIFNTNFNAYTLSEEGVMEAEAGAKMYDLSVIARDKSFSGLEIFYDIPSSIGGAVVMNAGASGEEIKDVLIKVRYLDLVDLSIKELDKDEINFSYRDSFFQRSKDKIILKVWLRLNKSTSDLVSSKMERIKDARCAKQPKEYPNAGSVFKRPEGRFVGPMIEELGLKGFSIGGAEVSEKHAGFIINRNNASGADILSLIDYIKRKIKDAYGVDLEVEQRII